MSESQEIALKTQLGAYDKFFKAKISQGRCIDCPLRESCDFVDDSTDTCGFIDDASLEFQAFVLQESQAIRKTDLFLLRTGAAIHGAILLSEKYFQCFGSVQMNRAGQYSFNELFSQYQKLTKQYQAILSELGLTPQGRLRLKEVTKDSSGIKKVADYIVKKYDRIPESKGKDRHHSVLSGPEATESRSEASTGSPSTVTLQTPDDRGADQFIPGDDWEEIPP